MNKNNKKSDTKQKVNEKSLISNKERINQNKLQNKYEYTFENVNSNVEANISKVSDVAIAEEYTVVEIKITDKIIKFFDIIEGAVKIIKCLKY